MSCTCSLVSCGILIHFLFLLWLVDTLTMANSHIAALEAKLTASREAWEGANAAKVTAEKAVKSAETKAKKAEKALATTDQKHVQRDRTIAKHLDKISALVGGKHDIIIFAYFARAPSC
jgi:chromosome segregation ATPase